MRYKLACSWPLLDLIVVPTWHIGHRELLRYSTRNPRGLVRVRWARSLYPPRRDAKSRAWHGGVSACTAPREPRAVRSSAMSSLATLSTRHPLLRECMSDYIYELVHQDVDHTNESATSRVTTRLQINTMPFNHQKHGLVLTAICTKEGLVLDIPPSGKLVVGPGDTLRCNLRLKDPAKIENLKLDFAGYQVSLRQSLSVFVSPNVHLVPIGTVFCPGHQKSNVPTSICGDYQ